MYEEKEKDAGPYVMTEEEKVSHDLFEYRKVSMQEFRKNVQGTNLEAIWRSADKACVPHTLSGTIEQKTMVSDDELGWRSSLQTLQRTGDWQEDSVPSNPYVKIQTALSILVDQNPQAVFKAFAPQYEAKSIIHQELYKRSWDVAHSKEQVKRVILNGSKYGILVMRTAPLKITRKVSDLVSYDEKTGKSEYEEMEITQFDDVFREAWNPWNVWFDEMAVPGDPFSMNDWAGYKDYSEEVFKERFGKFENSKHVKCELLGGQGMEDEGPDNPKVSQAKVVRVWFYENLAKDLFYVEANGICIVNSPLPRDPKNKRLSMNCAPWTLRNSETIYGIGTYEAMKNDYKMYTKVRNMTVDQLVLSIYKEFFYEGTGTLENTGQMSVRPGYGRQVSSPDKIRWNEVPGPGQEAWQALDWIKREMDDVTGITKTLEGELSPKAKAFDIAQARESALRRMKVPLDNLAYLLEQDAYISVGLFQELYSIPRIEKIVDPDTIAKYREMKASGEMPENLDLDEMVEYDEEGMPQEAMEVKEYKQFPLSIERDKKGGIAESDGEKFFTVRPDDLPWEGQIRIKVSSLVPESPVMERQETLEMANLLIPLFAQPAEIVLPAAKQILKAYNQDPRKWMPPSWLAQEQQMMTGQGMNPVNAQLYPAGQASTGMEPAGPGGGFTPSGGGMEAQTANRVIPATNTETHSPSVVQKQMQQMIKPLG